MNGMIKKLAVMMLAVIMVFGMVVTPAEAKGGKGHKPQPTPEPTVEPAPETPQEPVIEPEEPVAEGSGEETVEPAPEETPAEDVVSEEEASPEEEIVITETEEPVVEETPAEEGSEGTIVVDSQFDAQAFARTLALNATGGTRAAGDVSINAGKTVTDTDGDGIYELALSVKATSDTSSSASVTKSNVVMVIDVSGSMGTDNYIYSEFTEGMTYNANYRYYRDANGNNRIYYRNGAWRYSNSDYGNVYTGTVYVRETRLDATKRAANAVVDALLAYNTNSDNITDIFEITVVKFANRTATGSYNGTQTIIRDSTNATAIKNAINALSPGGGTNWQAALEQALTEANYFKNTDTSTDPDNPENTSVIFLTDGFPSYYGNDQGGGNDGNATTVQNSYNNSRTAARNIVAAGYTLYNIFAYGSDSVTRNGHTGFQYLQALANWAYGSNNTDNYNATNVTRKYCFNAKSTSDLVAAFNTIIDHITNNVGYAGVNLSDGVSLGATSTSVAVNGTAKADTMRYTVTDAADKIAYTVKFSNGTANFTIYNADGTTATASDSEAETVTTNINGTVIHSQVYSVDVGGKTYKISPATIDADTGMVKWDLAGLGILESGYTYTVAFDVWPNQLAYDIAADLNNGIYATVDAALDAYNVTDATERQHIKDAIVHNADGSYSLYTNYSQEIEYYPATSETDDNGNVTWTYGDKQTQNLPHPDPIPLKGSLLPMEKEWKSGLAQSEMDELLWEDGVVDGTSKQYQITLYVWKAETEEELEQKVQTGVTAANQPYITEILGWDAGTNTYDWDKDIAVAPGTMVNIDEAEELGFDITDQSKIREFTNDEGTTLTYYVIENGHYYYVTEDGADLHFELETVLYHPMIVDGTLYNVAFGEGKTVEKMDPMKTVTATNTLKGGLNVHKIVSTTQIAVEDNAINNVTEPVDDNGIETVTDEFTYEIKIWKVDDDGNKSAVYTYDDQIDTAANKTKGGSIGYRVFSEPTEIDPVTGDITYGQQLRGAILTENSPYADLAGGIFATIENNETTIVLTMPANGEIRLVNLPAGTQYQVREIVDDGGNYNYAATENKTKLADGSYDNVTVTTGNTVTGKIKGNTASVETYYNWAAAFYVYHSSDNTVEKISFADERVKGTYDTEKGYIYTFDIVNETKENQLYGGYYKVYSGAKKTDAQIVASEYTDGWMTDTGATPYDASKASVWKKTNAYTTTVEATGGGKGTEMTPVNGTVYYLKEVPNGYIRPYIHYTYDQRAAGNPLKKLYLITASDDQNYDAVGYMIKEDENAEWVETGVPKASLIITIKKPDGTTDATLTAKNIWNAKAYHGETVTLSRGYLWNTDFSKYIGKGVIFRPCWRTLDDVLVKGVTVRTVNDAKSADNIGVTDVAAGDSGIE